MARLFATRIASGSCELIHANRFAEKSQFSKRLSDSRESPQICDSQFFVPQNAFRKQGVQFGNPEMIRTNRAIRANLRIDSRESGHCSCCEKSGVSCTFRLSKLLLCCVCNEHPTRKCGGAFQSVPVQEFSLRLLVMRPQSRDDSPKCACNR